MCRKRFGKKLDMSSDAAGNTPTGDHAVASSRTSLEAAAIGGRVTAGADSNRFGISPFNRLVLVAPIAGS